MSDTNLATVRQAAERLDIPVAWLKREALANRVPHLRIGRRLLFNIAAVEQVLLKRAGNESEQMFA